MKLSSMLLVVGLVLVGFSTTGCDSKKFDQAKRAATTIQKTLPVAKKLVDQLQAELVLESTEADKLRNGISEVERIFDEFNDRAKGYQDWSPQSRQDMLKLVKDVSQSLDTLNQEGVLHIKNPDAKLRVGRVLRTISIFADVLQIALEDQT